MASFNPHRILVADDDDRQRELLGHYLKNWGFIVVACRDGLEAANILEGENAPSIALIDWIMPGLEGVEICRRVRAQPQPRAYIYLILVTGNAEAARGLEAGADDFVSKPYDVDELHARLIVGQRVVSLERRLAEHIGHLRGALDQLAPGDAAGTICLCPTCQRARDGMTPWQPIESFLRERTGSSPVREKCPDCRRAAGEGS
jgi:sigma-B regulation protein RsbU (phosphoserine phosphatase)